MRCNVYYLAYMGTIIVVVGVLATLRIRRREPLLPPRRALAMVEWILWTALAFSIGTILLISMAE